MTDSRLSPRELARIKAEAVARVQAEEEAKRHRPSFWRNFGKWLDRIMPVG